MNTNSFDRLSTLLATRRTRRQALAVGGLAASTLAATAQDATPPASPAPFPSDPHPSADSAGTHPEYLFVQPFDAGTLAPKASEDGTYTLTLTGAAAQTTYFSDRPERNVGLAPTKTFLDGLGFAPENPPNAAIVTQDDSGAKDILVVELMTPVYDDEAATLTYDAKVLADYGERGLATLAQQQTDYTFPETFGEGSLFIDDCPDSVDADACWYLSDIYPTGRTMTGYITTGNCWDWSTWTCNPCGSFSWLCNQTIGDCYNACVDEIELCGSFGCGGGR